MATVRATCPDCGDVQLTVADVTVTVDIGAVDGDGWYRFRCPSCRGLVSKTAQQRTIALLEAAGVEKVVWAPPAELFDPARFHTDPIGHDDVLDAHLLLADDAAFQAAVARLEEGTGR